MVTLLVMVLVSGVALAAMSNSREEMMAGGRSRSVITSLFAAEAGVQFAERRLLPPRDLSAFTLNVSGMTVQSRERDQGSAQPISAGGIGKPPSGYSINIGSGFVNEIFEVHSTAANARLPTTGLEVRLGLLTPNAGSY
ncbi:MAG: hypothetical protein ACR2O6_05370 [Ilumatobacteraceae bacterium]